MIDTWRHAADAVGERAAALGQSPDGRTATVAARTPLTSLAEGPQPDSSLVTSLTAILTDAVGLIRERTDRIEDLDTVTRRSAPRHRRHPRRAALDDPSRPPERPR
jgi:starvation-inducible DNA-binding protein